MRHRLHLLACACRRALAWMLPVLFLLLPGAQARADWYAAYSGGPNHGADAFGAAVDQFFHFYGSLPGAAILGPCGITNNPQGRPTTSCAHGHATGHPSLNGYGTNSCPSGTFPTLMGCSKGNDGNQGGGMCEKGTGAGNPIDMTSGNKFEVATDFTTRGASPLALTRYYNSNTTYVASYQAAFSTALGAYKSRFGYAWRMGYDRFIAGTLTLTTVSIDAYRPDGNPVHFTKSAGVWYTAYWNPATQLYSLATDPRHDVDLKISLSGTNWLIKDADDTVETYDNTGKLVSIAYRGGYSQTFTYDSSATTPSSPTSSAARSPSPI